MYATSPIVDLVLDPAGDISNYFLVNGILAFLAGGLPLVYCVDVVVNRLIDAVRGRFVRAEGENPRVG